MIRDKGGSRREGGGRGGLTKLMETGDIAKRTSPHWGVPGVGPHSSLGSFIVTPRVSGPGEQHTNQGALSRRYADGRTIVRSPTPHMPQSVFSFLLFVFTENVKIWCHPYSINNKLISGGELVE